MRRLPQFAYFRPGTFAEAVGMLEERRGKVRPFAGGTDLLVGMKEKGLAWDNLVDLKWIAGGDFIRETDGRIEIGALASIRSIETSGLIQRKYPFLAEAAGKLGSVQIRNKATLGGNICNASPAADLAPPLIALRAEVETLGKQGTRSLPLEEFFIGPGKSALGESELVTKVTISPLPSESGGSYLKNGPRRAMDIAVVGVACVLTLDAAKRRCKDCRIVLGSVAPTPLRAKRAEAVVCGTDLNEDTIVVAGETARVEASPITDIRGSAEFRSELVKVYVRRSIRAALVTIRSGSTK